MDALYRELQVRAQRFIVAEQEFNDARSALLGLIQLPFARPSLLAINWKTIRRIGLGGLPDEQRKQVLEQIVGTKQIEALNR
jgi:hypothetical protein